MTLSVCKPQKRSTQVEKKQHKTLKCIKLREQARHIHCPQLADVGLTLDFACAVIALSVVIGNPA